VIHCPHDELKCVRSYGNPKGRPKGAKNLSTLLLKVGRERVRVTINGRTRTITKLEAILLQLANKAISGEDRAAKEILHLHSLYEDSDKTGLPQADQDEKDEATWDNIVKRILKSDPGPDDGTSGAATKTILLISSISKTTRQIERQFKTRKVQHGYF
jgi:hypothetical protein